MALPAPESLPRRALIVNADDFGQSTLINEGVIEAHERGIVTSASLLVRWPAAEEAAEYAHRTPSLSVGLHLDLGEWHYLDGEWVLAHEVCDARDAEAVALQLETQLEAFRRLVGRDPTHLDAHQHAHHHRPARDLAIETALRLGIPLRGFTDGITYSGVFYGQTGKGEPFPEALTVEALIAALEDLSPGWTELGCHPGRRDPSTPYGAEREREVAVLCDGRIRAAVERLGIALCSFHDYASSAAT